MDVTTTPVSTAAQFAGQSAATVTTPETDTSERVLSSDFETFLVMLTAQIENQDPLNPIDSTDYAVQLATFSSVEQQVLTNELLQEMSAAEQSIEGLSTYADWVGMEARVADQATLTTEGATLAFDVPIGFQNSEIVITNLRGEEVRRLPVNNSDTEAFWDGRNSEGARLENGTFNVSLTARDANGDPLSASVYSYSRVAEARMGTDGVELGLADGRTIDPDTVTALRDT
ncbi:MAG: flagellar hook capping FlgD N-terminal domain-containing protein [Pseudomonadota bacterium]